MPRFTPSRSALPAALALALGVPEALAQGLSDLAPNLPRLPDPPFHEHHLFENPWPGAIAFLLVGLTAAYALNRAGRAKPALGALVAGLAIAAGVIASGVLVRTDRERVADACRALVAATADADTPALRRMLHENVRATSSFASPTGRDQVVGIVERRLPAAGINEARVPEVNAALSGIDMATTQVRVVADTEWGSPGSWWRVDWLKDPDAPADHPSEGWQATHIELLWTLGGP